MKQTRSLSELTFLYTLCLVTRLLIEKLLVRIENSEDHDQADKGADLLLPTFLGGEYHMYDSPKWIISSDLSKILSSYILSQSFNATLFNFDNIFF